MNSQDTIKKWIKRAKRFQIAHRLASKAYSSLHLLIGIPAIITAVSASVLAQPGLQWNSYLVPLLTLTASILSALQTFLKPESLSSMHQRSDTKYGEIKARLESMQVSPPNQDQLQALLNQVEDMFAQAKGAAPLISERHWKKARKILSHE